MENMVHYQERFADSAHCLLCQLFRACDNLKFNSATMSGPLVQAASSNVRINLPSRDRYTCTGTFPHIRNTRNPDQQPEGAG